MATIDWLASLPQSLMVDDYNQAAADNTLRSPMDVGPAKVRRRSSSAVKPVSGSIVVTAAQLADFENFGESTLLHYTLRFNWVNPYDGVTAVEMRFTGPPQFAPANKAATRYRIRMGLEILP